MASEEEYNTHLATRQIEINEWAYEDKMDTLFVFQILFIGLLLVVILFYLKSMGVFPSSFVWYVIFILALIIGIIIINRASFTARRRDTRYWNRRRFDEDQKKESPIGRGDASYLAYIDAVRGKYGEKPPSCK
jgi:hypothetical protein